MQNCIQDWNLELEVKEVKDFIINFYKTQSRQRKKLYYALNKKYGIDLKASDYYPNSDSDTVSLKQDYEVKYIVRKVLRKIDGQ